MERTAAEMRTAADEQLSRPGTAVERISEYLQRERDVMRGCPIGRLTQDPDVIADRALQEPVTETFAWLQERLASVPAEGQAAGDFDPEAHPEEPAAKLTAVLQGGYVLARSATNRRRFDDAVRGCPRADRAPGRPKPVHVTRRRAA